MGKSTPRAPDPAKVSAADAKGKQETAAFQAQLDRIDQSSPFGSIDYSVSGTDPTTGAPIYSQKTTLSPQLQALMDSQVGSQQGISNAITGAIGNLPQGNFDPNIDVGDIRQRSMDSQMALLTPQFEQGWKNLEGTMSDRGIPIGAEIWNDQQGEYNRARDSSILGAARTADQDANNEYQRQFQNEYTKYQQPLQTLGALMGNSQAVGNPQFSGVPQVGVGQTDTSGNIWRAYEAEKAAADQSGLMSGLLGLGKLGVSAYSAGMFSDIRLKRNIKRIGAMSSGIPLYTYNYVWDDEPQTGVMAQDVLQIFPDAIGIHPSGYYLVDYSRIA